jgi:probable HAF family extracellular repeat protein
MAFPSWLDVEFYFSRPWDRAFYSCLISAVIMRRTTVSPNAVLSQLAERDVVVAQRQAELLEVDTLKNHKKARVLCGFSGVLDVPQWQSRTTCRRLHRSPATSMEGRPSMICRPLGALATVCLIAGLALRSTAALAQANLLTDLGTGAGFGINNSGQIALSAGIYNNGTVTPLGMLPGDTTNVVPNAINASGQVAGNSILPTVPSEETAVFYNNGVLTSFGASSVTLDQSFATGINASGQIVGFFTVTGDSTGTGFVYNNGVLTNLGGLPGSVFYGGTIGSVATGINDTGQITGAALNTIANPSRYDAVIYNGTWTDIGPGEGFAINAAGQVTGAMGSNNVVIPNYPAAIYNTPVPGHAFIYRNGTMTDLGVLPGGTTAAGYAINATGQIVGASDGTGFSGQHAFFYNGGLTDMNALVSATDPLQPFVTLTDAHGINDSRLIVANGIDSRTHLQHAYLLQGPWLDVAPGPLSFPSQAIGTVSPAQTVSLTNSGSTSMTLSAIATSGDFSQMSSCGSFLAASAGCTVMVTFRPTAAGSRIGILTVISAGVPITVPLVGIAPIQVGISSSAVTTTAGVPVKLTWTVSPGSACTASGGSAADGWTGTVALSGTQSVTESVAGTYPYGLSCTAGTQSQSNQTSVVVTWPVVSVSLTASPASFTAGQSVTLKWSSVNATSCLATGGGAGDTWPGAKGANGSATLTEPYAPATPSLKLTFTLKCTSSASGLSANGSASAIENAVVTAPAKSGGGALDAVAVLFLTGVAALRRVRRMH